MPLLSRAEFLGRQFASRRSLDAAMILTGTGPVDRMETRAGKLLAFGYAFASAVLFLTTIAVPFAPPVHFCHRFHLELDAEPE